jgi:hypothetical protein
MKRLRLQDMVIARKRSFKVLMPLVLKRLDVFKIDRCIEHVLDLYENY